MRVGALGARVQREHIALEFRRLLLQMPQQTPADAARPLRLIGLEEGTQVRVSSVVGSLDLVVRLSDELASGVVLIEHGWGTRVFDPVSGEVAFSSGAIRNRLVDNSVLDPFSGTPRLNGMPVKVEAI